MKYLKSFKKALARDMVFTMIFGLGIFIFPVLFFLFWGMGNIFTIGSLSSIGATLLLLALLNPDVKYPGRWVAIPVVLSMYIIFIDGITLSHLQLFILIGGSMIYFVVLLSSCKEDNPFFRIKRKNDLWSEDVSDYNETRIMQLVLPILAAIIFLGNDTWWWVSIPLVALIFMHSLSTNDYVSTVSKQISGITISGLLLAWPAIIFVSWSRQTSEMFIYWIWDVRIWIGSLLGLLVIAFVTRSVFLMIQNRRRRIADEKAEAIRLKNKEEQDADKEKAEEKRFAEIQRILDLDVPSDDDFKWFFTNHKESDALLSSDAVFTEATETAPTNLPFSILIKLCAPNANPTQRAALVMRYLKRNGGLHKWIYTTSEEHSQVFYNTENMNLVENARMIAILLSSQKDEHVREGKRLMRRESLPAVDQQKIRNGYKSMMCEIFETVEKECNERGKKIFKKIHNPYLEK